MKILVIMLYWYPYQGPVIPIYGSIFEDLIDKGHEITIVTSFPHYRKGRKETWREYRGKLWENSRWKKARLIRTYVYAPIFDQEKSGVLYRILNFLSFNVSSLAAAMFVAGKTDVIFAPSSPPLSNGIICFIASWFKGCPMVYNVQDLYPDIAVRMGVIKTRWLVSLLRRLERLVYRLSTQVVTISENMRKIIAYKGVPFEKISVIENFVDADFVAPGPKDNDFSRSYGLVDDFVVMYAGNIGVPHGVDVLIHTAEILKNEPKLIFCFVARGENKEMVEAMARDKALKNTMFIPPQPEALVPLIWASASVGMVTYRKSLADFSLPSKLLAMMGAARPVIASVDEDSDTARIITQSGCGFVVPPESAESIAAAVIHMKTHPQVAGQMGQNGRQYVEENLQRKAISDRYDALFRSLT